MTKLYLAITFDTVQVFGALHSDFPSPSQVYIPLHLSNIHSVAEPDPQYDPDTMVLPSLAYEALH
jgi:hypothetical protein